MYEIYVNDNPLLLMNKEEYDQMAPAPEDVLDMRYNGKTKELFRYIDLLEKTKDHAGVWIYGTDGEALFEAFKSLHEIIEAAGGLIYNTEGQVLAIFRLEHWDLPKGKIDPGETPEIAALREVAEETGLDKATLQEQLPMTWHTYKTKKGKRILKPTYWYRMTTIDTKLTLQTEEGIITGVWMSIETLLRDDLGFYRSIKKLLRQAIKQD